MAGKKRRFSAQHGAFKQKNAVCHAFSELKLHMRLLVFETLCNSWYNVDGRHHCLQQAALQNESISHLFRLKTRLGNSSQSMWWNPHTSHV